MYNVVIIHSRSPFTELVRLYAALHYVGGRVVFCLSTSVSCDYFINSETGNSDSSNLTEIAYVTYFYGICNRYGCYKLVRERTLFATQIETKTSNSTKVHMRGRLPERA